MPHIATPENSLAPHTVHSQPINATAYRRVLTLIAIKLLKRVRKRSGIVLFLSDKICVKYGSYTTLAEASTMQFIAKHTSIPVPRVYCAFQHKNRTYIVMERIPGESISNGWLKRLEPVRARMLEQLKRMIEDMRRILPPEGVGVANVDGGPLFDCRVPGPSNSFGPFNTIHDFHQYLRGGLDGGPQHEPEFNKFVSQQDEAWPAPVFTHGDLSSLNILASGDRIVGIVDWESAGWYPSYWEYTTAWHVNPYNEFWRSEVDKFLTYAQRAGNGKASTQILRRFLMRQHQISTISALYLPR
ncbi:kinase-like protein [Decorospora gaudefroyi]|uniref:Kinase-like protein n=1 Tax=Decorospora gaudefroyi TaxID=184978 RepID=A0A6A5KID2_9PLEO|nr:kinase-like protein [Decorospora gaudefroyi]